MKDLKKEEIVENKNNNKLAKKEEVVIYKNIKKLTKKGKIQQAIEYCQDLISKDTTNPKLHIRLGDLYLDWHLSVYQAKQYIDEAITEYQKRTRKFGAN